MRYKEERYKILETCREMAKAEYFIGTWGNISLRVEDAIILTPSRMDYDLMKAEDMVIIDMQGNKIEGERNPTSEKEVHRQIYLQRADVKAIIHVHTKSCMAVSAIDIAEIPCLTEEMSQLLGGSINLTESYVPAEEHKKLGISAASAIKDRSGVIIRNHGAVCVGRDMPEAVLVTKVMEKACKIYLMIAGANKVNTIPDKYVQTERYRFLYKYGRETI